PIVGSPQKSFMAQYCRKEEPSVNELKEYFKLPAEDFDACNQFMGGWVDELRSCPYAWFPNLFHLACDILCIPGSAVAEWVLSGGQDTISLCHASLNADDQHRLGLDEEAAISIHILMLVEKCLHLAHAKATAALHC
ncbi:hypothetical protein L208DRAFT_1245147, partial [Tricholoma matsutake]